MRSVRYSVGRLNSPTPSSLSPQASHRQVVSPGRAGLIASQSQGVASHNGEE
jgi:hypothetical protein